jgi:hypothetical protein
VHASPGFHSSLRCSLSNSKSLSGSLLLGQTDNWLVGLGDLAGPLDAVELNVAVRGDVWRDATVSAVGPSAASDSALNGNVADDALLGVEALGLGVALEVDEELADSLGRLFGPSAVAPLVLSSLGVSGDVLVEPAEGNNLLVSKHAFHILDSSWNSHAFNVSCSFEGVLEVSSQVRNLGFGGCTGELI